MTTINLLNLQENEVDLYINGHDHCLQHISSNDRYVGKTQCRVQLIFDEMLVDFNCIFAWPWIVLSNL